MEPAELIIKYFKGELSTVEKQELEAWLAADEQNRALLERFRDQRQLADDMAFFDGIDVTADWEAVAVRAGYDTSAQPKRRRMVLWSAVAASILLATGLLTFKKETPPAPLVAAKVNDIQPGSNKAVLQLANGQTVTLGRADTSLDADGAKIRQQQGALVYKGKEEAAAAVQYNTLSTPRGGQFQLVLADGTAVWLNASSSIRFPTRFEGKERIVELTGEGYFEVAKDQHKPFRVKVNGVEIAVLGTHFNVMAYQGVTKTTLAEGSVKIQLADNRSWLLKPGQQGTVKENQEVNIAATDVEKALAWKNGLFYFKDDEIKDIVAQLARWYDVDIQLKGTIPAKQISGNIRRQATLLQVLEMLNYVSGAKYTLDQKKVTVSF
ncbi:FecR domain-containing protein [Chitinophaga niabensis]|uniref:FecR protein n=1 Tax=Chitinophaga niabensis TaxID=536979 RepID=A0A1N6D367_9BACT|nr:FecR domain-containing protein [Chitinophaga niabensis]SIN65124.1 FecR protein [Chitinophaga niabensis]